MYYLHPKRVIKVIFPMIEDIPFERSFDISFFSFGDLQINVLMTWHLATVHPSKESRFLRMAL